MAKLAGAINAILQGVKNADTIKRQRASEDLDNQIKQAQLEALQRDKAPTLDSVLANIILGNNQNQQDGVVSSTAEPSIGKNLASTVGNIINPSVVSNDYGGMAQGVPNQQANQDNPLQGVLGGLSKDQIIKAMVYKKLGLDMPDTQEKVQGDIAKKQAEADIKTQGEIKAGQRMANQSMGMVSGSLQELAKTYSDAVEEGGVGNRLNMMKSGIANWMGGAPAEQFSATSAFPGQKTEVIARMMPLLTQQGDKPGSVRLVQTVFDKLEKTLPDESTPPKNARRMMEQTIRNMYRFSRASQMMSDMGVTDENWDQYSDQEKTMLSNQLQNLANSISLNQDEESQVNELIGSALSPIDRLIGGDVSRGTQQQSNRVQVVSPNGQTGTIPQSQLQDALSQGYKQVQ